MPLTQSPESSIRDPGQTALRGRPVADVAAPDAHERAEPAWGRMRRVGFRFLFAYFVLYLFPFPLDGLPIPGNPLRWWTSAQNALARWTETTLFGLPEPVPIVPTGSGDTMAQWALQVDWLLLAAGIAIAWSLLDRRHPHYTRLEDWLRVYVRFGLAVIMFSYGFAKIIPTQMPAPQLERLVSTWGESSPMGVLWTFMGVSPVYQIFTGVGEALGGALLLFRRTTTLGALILIGVLSNVVLLNFTFDVPVKLYSTNLLLMAVFLAAFDARRLVYVLMLNRDAEPQPTRVLFSRVRTRRIAAGIATCFIAFTIYNYVARGLRYYRGSIGPDAPRSALYGIWDVQESATNSVLRPQLLSDSAQIRRAIFGGLNRATFRLMSDSVQRFTMTLDTASRQMQLTARFDPQLVHTFSYERPDPDHLVLNGVIDGDTVVLRLRRFDEQRLLLVSRGFNWIQEQPFNR